MDEGPEAIADKVELAHVRRLGRRVLLTAVSSAGVATSLFLLPG